MSAPRMANKRFGKGWWGWESNSLDLYYDRHFSAGYRLWAGEQVEDYLLGPGKGEGNHFWEYRNSHRRILSRDLLETGDWCLFLRGNDDIIYDIDDSNNSTINRIIERWSDFMFQNSWPTTSHRKRCFWARYFRWKPYRIVWNYRVWIV